MFEGFLLEIHIEKIGIGMNIIRFVLKKEKKNLQKFELENQISCKFLLITLFNQLLQ